jgi:hypothetical protein
MAGKPQNRLELRRQYDAAEPLDPMEDESEDLIDEGDEDEAERKPKKKAKAPAKSKAKAAKTVKPAARVRIVWAVVNDAFKTLATFDYNQKEAAQAKADELTAKGKGSHFLQKVKEPMAENAPGLGAAIPRPVLEPEPIAAKSKPEPIDGDDDADDDEDESPDDSADDEDDE